MLRKLLGNQHRLLIITSILWIFYGIFSVLRYRKTGDDFLLWSGIIISSLHALVLVGLLLKKDQIESN